MFKSLSSTISTEKLSVGSETTLDSEVVSFPKPLVATEGSGVVLSLGEIFDCLGLVCATDLRVCRTFRGENLEIVSNEMIIQHNGRT